MFDRILSFLQTLPRERGPSRLGADDPHVAAAALLFHVMDADGQRSEEERQRLKDGLSAAYGVTGAGLDALMRAGEEADREAVDLYAFTSVLKRELDEEARAEFIRLMWEVVFADGEMHELEDNMVWRVAELLGVSSRVRVLLRKDVREQTKLSEKGRG
jgi:uncharacterized tellurite resistance protein B-like protein